VFGSLNVQRATLFVHHSAGIRCGVP